MRIVPPRVPISSFLQPLPNPRKFYTPLTRTNENHPITPPSKLIGTTPLAISYQIHTEVFNLISKFSLANAKTSLTEAIGYNAKESVDPD